MDANSHEAGGIFDRACTAAPPLLKPVREFLAGKRECAICWQPGRVTLEVRTSASSKAAVFLTSSSSVVAGFRGFGDRNRKKKIAAINELHLAGLIHLQLEVGPPLAHASALQKSRISFTWHDSRNRGNGCTNQNINRPIDKLIDSNLGETFLLQCFHLCQGLLI